MAILVPAREHAALEPLARAETPSPVIDLRQVSARFGGHVAVDAISTSVGPGALVALVGPNGAGKTTLLKMLAREARPSSGQISVSAPRSRVAYMPQGVRASRDAPMTVAGLVSGGLWARVGLFGGVSRTAWRDVHIALQAVGLAAMADTSVNTLSGGQLQRALFARAIVQDANVILLDEPFSAVDAATVEDLMAVLCGWIAQGRTVIAAMHDLELVRRHFPRTILIARRVIADGDTAAVLSEAHLQLARASLDAPSADSLCIHPHEHAHA